MATQGIGFTGDVVVLDSDAVLTLGIQFVGQPFAFQFFDDGCEGCLLPVDSLLLPFTYR